MPCWIRRRVSSFPRIWHSSTAPPGVVGLPETATRTGAHDSPVFQPPFLGQVDEGVVHGIVGPVGHPLRTPAPPVGGPPGSFRVGLHLLMGVQIVGVGGELVKEIRHGGISVRVSNRVCTRGPPGQVNGGVVDGLLEVRLRHSQERLGGEGFDIGAVEVLQLPDQRWRGTWRCPPPMSKAWTSSSRVKNSRSASSPGGGPAGPHS